MLGAADFIFGWTRQRVPSLFTLLDGSYIYYIEVGRYLRLVFFLFWTGHILGADLEPREPREGYRCSSSFKRGVILARKEEVPSSTGLSLRKGGEIYWAEKAAAPVSSSWTVLFLYLKTADKLSSSKDGGFFLSFPRV